MPHQRLTRDLLRGFHRVTVMGLGQFGGGAGAARFFATLGARVTVTDMADQDRLARSIATLADVDLVYHLGGHVEADFTDTDLIVTNQAVRPDNRFLQLARARNIPVVTETGLALGLNRSPWVGVTGSSGKSTTASLIAEMLHHHDPASLFGGNIGGDLLTRVEGRAETAPLTVELSSFQLTYIGEDLAEGRAAAPRVAVITNVTPNHLDWHHDMDEYIGAKRNLLRYQTRHDQAVLNMDDPLLADCAERVPGQVIRCALADPGGRDACFMDGGEVVLRRGGQRVISLPCKRFKLIGRHNLQNAIQAVAAAHAMTGDAESVRAGFFSFPGLPHRLEQVAVVNGRRFINDSKATTPEAAILALDAVTEPAVLIAGGYDKLSPMDHLGRTIQAKAAGLVLVGATGPRLKKTVIAAAASRPVGLETLRVRECGDDFSLAVETAFKMAPDGGAILLSPGCASYDMFVNYEERGRVFREIALELERLC